MMKLKRSALILFIFSAVCASALARSSPTLSGRTQSQQPPSAAAPKQAPAASQNQQEDYSGMYTFLREGEFVQVNCEDDGTLTGFVSRFGDDASDKGSFLDQFFDKGTYKGSELHFITKAVHNVWYEFTGTVQRGPGKTPRDEGFRTLKGKLVEYTRDAQGKTTAQSRELEMKSFPNEDEPESDSKN